ncbi:MAG: hypothetical protein HY014_10815 [Acidobacteria bacterium]|nr:hypothetical protein [Acidobacteriota bacterium]MBI3488646.1 hypothetical protein [Acidobacteriota bacterium]
MRASRANICHLWRTWTSQLLWAVISLLVSNQPLRAVISETLPIQFVHQKWHTTDGLPQETVSALARSSEGYLWVGTQDGLARYDGHRFVLFHPRNTPTMNSRWIQALAAGKNGEVWIGGNQGLSLYKEGRIEPVTAINLSDKAIRCLLLAQNGALYVGTASGLFRLENGIVDPIQAEGDPKPEIINMSETSSGEIALVTRRHFYRVEGKRLVPRPKPSVSEPFRCLRFDRSGRLWCGGRAGLWCEIKGVFQHIPISGMSGSNNVTEIFEDSAQTLWIATLSGLCRIPSGPTPQIIHVDYPMGAGVSWSEDPEGGIWVGTWGDGLHRLHAGRVTIQGKPEGLPSDYALCLYQSRDGAMWFGTKGGLARTMKNQQKSWGASATGLLDPHVQAIFEDEDGAIWIGTWANLARMVDGQLRDSGIPGQFFAIESDGMGGLWLGSNKGLMHIQDRRAIHPVATQVPIPNLNMVWMIHKSRNGDLWLAGDLGGLVRMRGGDVKTYLPPELPREPIISVMEETDGTLWFGTAGSGIIRFNGTRFDRITTSHGLPDDVIYTLMPHLGKDVWLSSNHGIFRVSLQSLRSVVNGHPGLLEVDIYGLSDGLRSLECNGTGGRAGIVSKDGNLYFPTTSGVAVINPTKPYTRSHSPVVIEEVSNDRTPLHIGPTIDLPPGRGELEFRFTTITFGTSLPIPLRYRLEGFDSDWRDSIGEWKARYTNLPPGHYTFKVESMVDGATGSRSSYQASININLAPHWYQRPWLLAMLSLIFGFFLLAINHLRVRRIRARSKAKRAELQRAVDDALRQIKVLQGLLPVCAWCKNVRSDEGFWQQIELYISTHSDVTFTHSICPDCSTKFRSEIDQIKP